MCNFSRTLYNRQLIQFTHIHVEFVVCLRRYKNCVKVITFSMAAWYLPLISSYSWFWCSLRVQCLELYTACILLQCQWDEVFRFSGNFYFLFKTITDSFRLRVVVLLFDLLFDESLNWNSGRMWSHGKRKQKKGQGGDQILLRVKRRHLQRTRKQQEPRTNIEDENYKVAAMACQLPVDLLFLF